MAVIITLLKEWKLGLVALLLLVSSVLSLTIHRQIVEYNDLEDSFVLYKKEVEVRELKTTIKQQEAALKASNDLRVLTENYNEKVKKLNDALVLNSSNLDSLHKQLDIARNAAKSKQTVSGAVSTDDTYTDTITELFRDCSSKYVGMAGEADKHQIAESKAVDTYNSLLANMQEDEASAATESK